MERLTFASPTATVAGRTLSGIAHAFGTVSKHGGHSVAFSAQAFSDALKTSDVYAFFGHDPNRILGHEKANTVRLAVVPEGLSYEIDLPDTNDGRDTATLVERGDLNSMSFGIIPGKYTTSALPAGGGQLRTYQSMELFDISPVSMPAFSGTSIQLHSADTGRARRVAASNLIRARIGARSINKETN